MFVPPSVVASFAARGTTPPPDAAAAGANALHTAARGSDSLTASFGADSSAAAASQQQPPSPSPGLLTAPALVRSHSSGASAASASLWAAASSYDPHDFDERPAPQTSTSASASEAAASGSALAQSLLHLQQSQRKAAAAPRNHAAHHNAPPTKPSATGVRMGVGREDDGGYGYAAVTQSAPMSLSYSAAAPSSPAIAAAESLEQAYDSPLAYSAVHSPPPQPQQQQPQQQQQPESPQPVWQSAATASNALSYTPPAGRDGRDDHHHNNDDDSEYQSHSNKSGAYSPRTTSYDILSYGSVVAPPSSRTPGGGGGGGGAATKVSPHPAGTYAPGVPYHALSATAAAAPGPANDGHRAVLSKKAAAPARAAVDAKSPVLASPGRHAGAVPPLTAWRAQPLGFAPAEWVGGTTLTVGSTVFLLAGRSASASMGLGTDPTASQPLMGVYCLDLTALDAAARTASSSSSAFSSAPAAAGAAAAAAGAGAAASSASTALTAAGLAWQRMRVSGHGPTPRFGFAAALVDSPDLRAAAAAAAAATTGTNTRAARPAHGSSGRNASVFVFGGFDAHNNFGDAWSLQLQAPPLLDELRRERAVQRKKRQLSKAWRREERARDAARRRQMKKAQPKAMHPKAQVLSTPDGDGDSDDEGSSASDDNDGGGAHAGAVDAQLQAKAREWTGTWADLPSAGTRAPATYPSFRALHSLVTYTVPPAHASSNAAAAAASAKASSSAPDSTATATGTFSGILKSAADALGGLLKSKSTAASSAASDATATADAPYVAPPGHTLLVLFGGCVCEQGVYRHYQDVHVFDTHTGTWHVPRVTGAPPSPRSQHSAVVLLGGGDASGSGGSDRMVVFGGTNSHRVFNDVYELDLATWHWTARPSMAASSSSSSHPLRRSSSGADADSDVPVALDSVTPQLYRINPCQRWLTVLPATVSAAIASAAGAAGAATGAAAGAVVPTARSPALLLAGNLHGSTLKRSAIQLRVYAPDTGEWSLLLPHSSDATAAAHTAAKNSNDDSGSSAAAAGQLQSAVPLNSSNPHVVVWGDTLYVFNDKVVHTLALVPAIKARFAPSTTATAAEVRPPGPSSANANTNANANAVALVPAVGAAAAAAPAASVVARAAGALSPRPRLQPPMPLPLPWDSAERRRVLRDITRFNAASLRHVRTASTNRVVVQQQQQSMEQPLMRSLPQQQPPAAGMPAAPLDAAARRAAAVAAAAGRAGVNPMAAGAAAPAAEAGSPRALADHVQSWSGADVGQWLAELNPLFVRYVAAFDARGIDGKALLQLNDDTLKPIVDNAGHRRTIAGSITGLRLMAMALQSLSSDSTLFSAGGSLLSAKSASADSKSGKPTAAKPATGGTTAATAAAANNAHAVSARELPILRYSQLTQIERLGEGSFGVTYRCFWHAHKRMVVVKVPKAKAGHDEWNELQAFLEVPLHANVIPLLGLCTGLGSGLSQSCCFVTQYMRRGSLRGVLLNDALYTELFGNDVRSHVRVLHRVCRDVARGLAHLHAHNILHRDVAARNILVADDGTMLVSDFGLSRQLQEDDSTPDGAHASYYRMSSPTLLPIRWLAPESMEDLVFTTQSDVWSFAVLVWELTQRSRTVPYADLPNLNKVMVSVITGRTRLQLPDWCPAATRALVAECFQVDPKLRPTMQALADAFDRFVAADPDPTPAAAPAPTPTPTPTPAQAAAVAPAAAAAAATAAASSSASASANAAEAKAAFSVNVDVSAPTANANSKSDGSGWRNYDDYDDLSPSESAAAAAVPAPAPTEAPAVRLKSKARK